METAYFIEKSLALTPFKDTISVETYAKTIASEVGFNSILFANKMSGKLIVYLIALVTSKHY